MKHLRAVANNEGHILDLWKGVLDTGEPFYAYFLVKLERYREFADGSKSKQGIDLNAYGQIIYWGKSENPPAWVESFMQQYIVAPSQLYLEQQKPELLLILKNSITNHSNGSA